MTVEVKVCGITKLKDAKFALLAGAKYLGFIFYAKSPRNISLEKSQLILEDLVNFSFGRVAVDVCPTPESVAYGASRPLPYCDHVRPALAGLKCFLQYVCLFRQRRSHL